MIRAIKKRDGRKVKFDKSKITDAINKAFNAVEAGDFEEVSNRIAEEVADILVKEDTAVPTVEHIQDVVENALIDNGYVDVAKAYILYRSERSKVREMKTSLMKTFEDITFSAAKDSDIKRENANVDGDTAMGTMLKYGSEGSKQFYLMFMAKPEHAKAHTDGDIHIHDMDFAPMGTTTCTQIDLLKLFERGFSTGHGFLRTPNDISSYAALACIAVQSNQNDQHGGQSIVNFDYSMAEGVKKTFKRLYRQNMEKAIELIGEITDYGDTIKDFVNAADPCPSLDNNDQYMENEKAFLKSSFGLDDDKIEKCQKFAQEKATKETDRATYQAMEALIHNLNTMHCLPASERFWVYDSKTGEIDLVSMEEFESVFEPERYKAFSRNMSTGEVELKTITHITKNDSHRNIVTTVATTGQVVRTTDNHRVLTYEDGIGCYKYPEDITNIVSPKGFSVPQNTGNIEVKNLAEAYSNTPFNSDEIIPSVELAELFGYYVADGSIVSNSTICFTTADKVEPERLSYLMTQSFGTEFSYNDYSFTKSDGNECHKERRFNAGTRLARAFKMLCGSCAEEKKVPQFVLTGTQEIKVAFMNAYFSCDAKVEKYIVASSVSKDLIKQLYFMALSLGELATLSTRYYSNGRKPMYSISIGNYACNRIGIATDGVAEFEIPKYSLRTVAGTLKDEYGIKTLPRKHSGNITYAEAEKALQENGISSVDSEVFLMLKTFSVPVSTSEQYNSEDEYVYDIGVADNENFMTEDGIFVHNSRAGAQTPFSSINYGMDTSAEARMVIKDLLLTTEAGLGNGETPIFPIQIFRVKDGVNYKEGDPNYDLFKLAIRCSAKRLFPNFSFVDAPFNLQYYKEGCPETEIAYMGAVTGGDVITVKNGDGDIQTLPFYAAYDLYHDSEDTEILDRGDFTKVLQWHKYPDGNDWYDVTFSNGRYIRMTSDHPLPTQRGRVYCQDLEIGDEVPMCRYDIKGTVTPDMNAWLIGYMACDWGGVTNSEYEEAFGTEMPEVTMEERAAMYGSKYGNERHLPSDFLSWTDDNKLLLMAGIIDANGSIDTVTTCRANIVFLSKAVALQTLSLADNLGFDARVRVCYPDSYHPINRYVVSFPVTKEIPVISSRNKETIKVEENTTRTSDMAKVIDIQYLGKTGQDRYDVTTESDRFDVSGINTHNCRTRVIGNVVDPERQICNGRGNLSFTTINLPRLAIESKGDIDAFYKGLDHMLDICVDQLLDRFEYQCHRKVKNFPFLMGQGNWIDSESLDWEDELGEVLKQGTLSVGFIGLAETLKSLLGVHHGESEEARELGYAIIKHMRDRMDKEAEERHLNFSLLATPAEGLSGRFVRIDKKKYGIIEGVTDREYYTNSFHVPVYYPITAYEKIAIEAPYHELTNAGHISYIEMDGDPTENLDAFEKVIRCMKEKGIGYGSVNHPVDRDPVCGFTGIIGDTCPGCGRKEDDVPFERIRRITGYLVGTLDRFNNAKRAEVEDRVKHGV